MPTPSKPYLVLQSEKKSHRSKAELKQREEGEKALLTGESMKENSEVKSNPVAHKEFLRINKLLKSIGKNDAIYQSIINRYCIMQAECFEFEKRRTKLNESLNLIDEQYSNNEIGLSEYIAMQEQIQTQIINIDKQLQTKRKMLLDIEKENVMTIAAALRSIPKKVEKQDNPLLKALNGS